MVRTTRLANELFICLQIFVGEPFRIDTFNPDRLTVFTAEFDPVFDLAVNPVKDLNHHVDVLRSNSLQNEVPHQHVGEWRLSRVLLFGKGFRQNVSENVGEWFLAWPSFRIPRHPRFPLKSFDLVGITSRFSFLWHYFLPPPRFFAIWSKVLSVPCSVALRPVNSCHRRMATST